MTTLAAMLAAIAIAPATATAATPSLPAVVSGSTNWDLRDSLSSGPPTTMFTLGTRPVVPFTGDRDGNTSETPGTSSGAPDAGSFVFWAGPGSYPVVGDWDANVTDTVGVKLGATWSLNNQNDAAARPTSRSTTAPPATCR